MLINIFGRPGVGKSTLALDLTANLKKMGRHAEYVPEYVKEMIYRAGDNPEVVDRFVANQVMNLAQQYQRLADVCECVDIVITDAPVLLNLLYLDTDPSIAGIAEHYKEVVKHFHNSFENRIDFFLKSNVKYEPRGRNQTYEQSLEVEKKLEVIAEEVGDFHVIGSINEVWDRILRIEV